MVAPGPLGWIEPALRTPEMHAAVADAQAGFCKFALARPTLPKGTKILLSDFWTKPEVVADLGGVIFTGFRQLTGACVGVSDGDACFTLTAVQRMLADNPTKAFIPWWCTSYGRSRALAGMRGRGEGSVDSIMGRQMVTEGVDDAIQVAFDTSDGFALTSSTELAWSDGNSSLVTARLPNAKQFPLGGLAPISDVDGIAASIINGYPILDGCNNYIGSGKVDQNGICFGNYNGRGGHSTTILGYWEHETLGPLYLYHNQWSGNTYPGDTTGKPRCSTWMLESSLKNLFTNGGNNGETMSLSHLNYHPAQPKVLDWSTI